MSLRRCWGAALAAAVLALAPAATGQARTAPSGLPSGNIRSGAVLSPTPYMGWDTYFAFGGTFDEADVLAQASRMVQLGLVKRGYDYVWLDAGWWEGNRGSSGKIEVNRTQWPHGIKWLASTLHSAGMRLGVYTDAGRDGCGGGGEGSFGHYTQDVDTFAAWGVDAIKVDFCGGSRQHLNPRTAYRDFHTAIEENKSRRAMLLSICDYLQPESLPNGQPPFSRSAFTSYQFGPNVGNSWRTDTDVGRPGHVLFNKVLRNLDADAAHPEAAGPGHWNDPDYLGPGQGMGAAQFRSQFSMWAILAAPLMVSANLNTISARNLATITNREAIAIDQDPAGIQGTLVSTEGDGQVWVKPLSDGSRAVALLNRGRTPAQINTSAAAVGMPAAVGYTVRNIWARSTTTTTGAITALAKPSSTVLLRISTEQTVGATDSG